MSPISYQDAGVDQDQADAILENFSAYLKGRPRDPSLLSGIGPFASCFSLATIVKNYRDPVLVTCCDGVGTKAKLALEWNRIKQLGEDLLAMNVNDLLCTGAKPLLFLDYYACGTLREEQLLPLLKNIQHACELSGCSLAGGETAEMPGVYRGEDFDLAGFAVGVVEREKILGASKVKPGDTLVALASSGLHSNGYSLVRKILEKEKIEEDAFAPFHPERKTWAEIILEPTTIYVPYLLPWVDRLSGLAHITGGGLFGNLPRILPAGTKAVVHSAKWPLPKLFQWLQEKSQLSLSDLLSTFNCGVGMIAACNAETAEKLIADLTKRSLPAWEIGHVEESAETSPFVEWK